jgi:hypothetical protein
MPSMPPIKNGSARLPKASERKPERKGPMMRPRPRARSRSAEAAEDGSFKKIEDAREAGATLVNAAAFLWRVFLNRPTLEDRVAACRDYSSQRKARFLQERPELEFGALTPAGQDHHQQIHQRSCRIIGPG